MYGLQSGAYPVVINSGYATLVHFDADSNALVFCEKGINLSGIS